MNDHCEHCDKPCYGTEEFEHYSSQQGAGWEDRCCPACAERKKIVEWLSRQEGVEIYLDTDGEHSFRLVPPAIYAARIERGEV